MKVSDSGLHTPLYLKLSAETPWPEDELAFYLLTADGLFFCRNHPFFKSSVLTEKGPAELAAHGKSLQLKFPKIPQRLFERVIGFFSLIADRYNAEAAVLLVWNRKTEAMEVVVPDQESIVGTSYRGGYYPINVYYDVPQLPPHLMPIGDIHSHADGAAYASLTDVEDELHRSGVHIVAGRIQDEPPDLHIEFSVDGARFDVTDQSLALEGYHRRRPNEVPQEWIDKVTVKTWSGNLLTEGRPASSRKARAIAMAAPPAPRIDRSDTSLSDNS